MPTAADVRHVVQERIPTWTGAHPVLFPSSWKTTLVSCHDQGEKESSTSFLNSFLHSLTMFHFTDLEESF